MPDLGATTTEVFADIGVDAETIYDTFTGLVGTAVSFGLWLVQVSWPFLLGVSFIYLMWRVAHKFMGIGR